MFQDAVSLVNCERNAHPKAKFIFTLMASSQVSGTIHFPTSGTSVTVGYSSSPAKCGDSIRAEIDEPNFEASRSTELQGETSAPLVGDAHLCWLGPRPES